MPVFQIELPRETAAQLAYVASLGGDAKGWVLTEIVKKAVAEEYRKAQLPHSSNDGPYRAVLTGSRRRGNRGSRRPVAYEGQDPRLNPQGAPVATFGSYNEVWRTARPEDAHWLYDPKLHRGNNGINLLRMHEPDIFRDLKRQ